MSDRERRDLRWLAERLLEQARRLGDPEAVATAQKVHQHVHADAPDTDRLVSHLRSLETKLALSPTVNAILQALANVGL